MATITKQFLSGSTNGRGQKLTDTGTSGNTDAGYLIHTATTGSDFDEIWIWATNTDAAAIVLTIEFGGVTAVDDTIIVSVAAKSTELVCPGLVLSGGLLVKAFAAAANKISLFGYVNRMDY